MKRRSETAWKLRFRQINRLRLKVHLHRSAKSAAKLSLHKPEKSLCFRKSAANLCKLSALSPVRRRSSPRSHGKEEQSLARRFETLRTLVPGSLGLDTPILLEKVSDYITALKMQVEVMQALAKLLENSAHGAASCLS